MPINGRVSTILFANYGLLGKEAVDSSLVEQRGDETQSTMGLFLNYRFKAKK